MGAAAPGGLRRPEQGRLLEGACGEPPGDCLPGQGWKAPGRAGYSFHKYLLQGEQIYLYLWAELKGLGGCLDVGQG